MTYETNPCPSCGALKVFNTHQYEKPQPTPYYSCERCGANGPDPSTITLLCRSCKVVTDKLYDLFVPHNCKDCSTKQRAEELRKGHVCGNCRKPYMDCCC